MNWYESANSPKEKMADVDLRVQTPQILPFDNHRELGMGRQWQIQ